MVTECHTTLKTQQNINEKIPLYFANNTFMSSAKKFTKVIQHIELYLLFHNFLSKNIILGKFSYKLPF